MAGPTPMFLRKKSQEGLLQFHNQCLNLFNSQYNIRQNMQAIDLAYAREAEVSVENERAKLANRYGDKTRFQNITIPVVMPQVETAVTYQTSVFLTGVPIFDVVASPQYENEALQMATAIDNQATRGGWTKEFMMFFRDGFKYGGISALEVSWDRETTVAIETDVGFSTKQGKPKEVIWEGNKIKRLDPYNIFFDLRVAPSEMYKKGEFFGYTELYSRTALKQFIASLPDAMVDNLTAAYESGSGSLNIGNVTATGLNSFFIPSINPNAMLPTQLLSTNWTAWAGIAGSDRNTINYKNLFEVTVLYARIIPSDFDIRVPGFNTPQVWKLIYINHQVLIYAERQTNAHGYIPVLMGQPNEDGLSYQTKSLAENALPIQEITSALSNSQIASRRRAISDRVLFDPSRITAADINSANPSAKIPVRPQAYGKNVADAVHTFPFRDDQAPVISSEIQFYGSLANQISGQNPVRQGQFVKGNKTLHEFSDVMANANGRDQMCSILYEDQVFTPLKHMLKLNILQYQGGVSLFSRKSKKQITIDPVALRKAVMEFKVTDGLVPTEKVIRSDTLQIALQVLGSSPEIAAEYTVGPMFSYLMKTQGAHIEDFEKSPEQKAYEQAVRQYQQMVLQLYKQNPNQDPAKLPPAPLPQQFGYDPKTAASDVANEERAEGE
jgi:hypothetical protein